MRRIALALIGLGLISSGCSNSDPILRPTQIEEYALPAPDDPTYGAPPEIPGSRVRHEPKPQPTVGPPGPGAIGGGGGGFGNGFGP